MNSNASFLHRLLEPKLVEVAGEIRAVFIIPTLLRGPAYMQISLALRQGDSRAVVWVEASRLLELWRREPNGLHALASHGTPALWKQDYKFHEAENRFSQSASIPVPLAEIYYGSTERQRRAGLWRSISRHKPHDRAEVPYISFVDGITRTLWLLAADAPRFPVQVYKNQALHLHHNAGVPGTWPILVEQLSQQLTAPGRPPVPKF